MHFGLEHEISDVTSEPKYIDFPQNQMTSQNEHHIVSGGPYMHTLNVERTMNTLHSKTASDEIGRSPIQMPISTG